MHDVFWCVLCVWAKLPEIKLDDDDDEFDDTVTVPFSVTVGLSPNGGGGAGSPPPLNPPLHMHAEPFSHI